MNNYLFEKIVKQFYDMGGGTVGIGSMQSDFLSDTLLIDRVKIINKYKKKLWVHSTTPLIACRRYSDKELTYILRTFDYLSVSAMGYDKESYRKMDGIDGFDIFKEQLERVKRIIDRNKLTVKIEIAFRLYDKRRLERSEFYREIEKGYLLFMVWNNKKGRFATWGTIRI